MCPIPGLRRGALVRGSCPMHGSSWSGPPHVAAAPRSSRKTQTSGPACTCVGNKLALLRRQPPGAADQPEQRGVAVRAQPAGRGEPGGGLQQVADLASEYTCGGRRCPAGPSSPGAGISVAPSRADRWRRKPRTIARRRAGLHGSAETVDAAQSSVASSGTAPSCPSWSRCRAKARSACSWLASGSPGRGAARCNRRPARRSGRS